MLKNKKSLLALVLSLALVIGSLAGYTIWNNAKDPIAKQASNSVSDYLEAYSSEYNLDTNVLGDASESNTGKVQLLTKEEIAQLSDTVYTTIQTTYTSDELVSEEDITNLKAQIYQSVYNQLYDKASADVINNVYENVIAICLDDLYNYADNQDAILKAALDDAIADIADNLLSVSDRVATAESDYETLDLMLSEYQAETGLELETMGKFYQALNASLTATNSQITGNTVSIMALESASKDTADRLNSLITSDLSQGNDNQALSASAGKTLFETMTAYYSNNNSNITNLSNNIDKKTAALESELLTLNNSVDSNANDLTNLNTRADSLRSDIDSLIDELGEANSDTINNTITNINNQLTQLLSQQNVDVTNLIDYLQQLYNNADDASKKLIQQLIVELSKTQATVDADLADLLRLLSDAQNATDDTSYQNAINSIKVLMESIKVSSPDIYNQINSYLEQIYKGDKLSINNVIDIVSGTLIEHNANLSQYLSNMLNLINNSELKDSQLFIEIIGKIKELQSLDTTMMQSAIYNSLQNLYVTIGSDTETMYNAVNSAILELNQANQNVSNQLTAVETKLSEDLAYTYYLLSSDLKLTNEELTNDIYAKYTELREADTVYNNALLTELNSVNESLREQNAKTKEQLLSDMAALSTAMSKADLAQLEALKAADEEAYNDLINRLTSLSDDLASADERNLAYLEKANSESYADLLAQLNGVNDTLLNLSEENLATLRAENEDAYNALTSALDVLGKEKDANVAELQSNLATLNSELSSTQKEQYVDLISKLTAAEESLAAANSASDEALRADLDKLSSDLASADAEAFNELTTRIAGVSASMEQANAQLNADLSSQLSALQVNLSNADAINKNDLLNQLDSAKAALEAANNESYVDLVNQLGNLHTELSNAQNEDYEDLIGQLGTLESTLVENANADKTEVLSTIDKVKAQLEAEDAENNAELISKLTTLQSDLETADADNMSNLVSQITDAKSELTRVNEESYADLITQLTTTETSLKDTVANDKAELQAALDAAKAQLEASDLANKTELLTSLDNVAADLSTEEGARIAAINSLDIKLADAKKALEESDLANKQALTSTINSVQSALDEEIETHVATLIKADADNLATLKAADNAINTDLLAHAEQLSNLASVNSTQNTTITTIQNKDAAQDTSIANIQSKDTTQDSKLTQLETAVGKAQSKADQAFQFASDGKSNIADAVTGRGVTVNSDMTFAELSDSIETIGNKSNATSGTMLQGTKAYVDGVYVDGSIEKKTAINKTLKAGESVTIPLGYYNTASVVNVATLASQTEANATAADVLSGKTVWVNGTKLTGSMPNNGAVSKTLAAGQSYTIPKGYHNGSGTVTVKSLADLTSITTNGAAAGDILAGKQAYVNGNLVTGTMKNNGAVTGSAAPGTSYTIPAGYHNGSGKVSVASLSTLTAANATAANILSGKTAWVNGTKITGTMPNNGAVTGSAIPGNSYTIPAGYHNGSGKVTAAPLDSRFLQRIYSTDLDVSKVEVNTNTFTKVTDSNPERDYDESFNNSKYITKADVICGLILSGASTTSSGTFQNRSCVFTHDVNLSYFKKASQVVIDVCSTDAKYYDSNEIQLNTGYTKAMVQGLPTITKRYTTHSNAATATYSSYTTSQSTYLTFTINKLPNSYKVLSVTSNCDLYKPTYYNYYNSGTYFNYNYVHAITSRCKVNTTTSKIELYLDSTYEDSTMRTNSVVRKDVRTAAKQEDVATWAENNVNYSYLGTSDDNAYEFYASLPSKKVAYCNCFRDSCKTCNNYNARVTALEEQGYSYAQCKNEAYKKYTENGETYDYYTCTDYYVKWDGENCGTWEAIRMSPYYLRFEYPYSTGTITYYTAKSNPPTVESIATDISTTTTPPVYVALPFDPSARNNYAY